MREWERRKGALLKERLGERQGKSLKLGNTLKEMPSKEGGGSQGAVEFRKKRQEKEMGF